jgi:hypothetical protein
MIHGTRPTLVVKLFDPVNVWLAGSWATLEGKAVGDRTPVSALPGTLVKPAPLPENWPPSVTPPAPLVRTTAGTAGIRSARRR